MNRLVVLLVLMYAGTSFAIGDCSKSTRRKPRPSCVAAVPTPCCTTPPTSCCAAATTTHTQIVNVNTTPAPVVLPKYHQPRPVVRLRVVERKERFPNRLQLLLGGARTDVAVEPLDCCQYKLKRKYTPDLGLQYLRDFGSLTGSVLLTTEKSMYLGLGFNW